MNILIFGVSNVGKTTVGRILADKLNVKFYDMDEEVKRQYNTTLENFVKTGTLEERDKIRGRIIRKLLKEQMDKVIAITPMSYPEYFEKYLSRTDVIAIELCDTVEHIFERLVFSDENDEIYEDASYKNAHRSHYMMDIMQDLLWYGNVYKNINNKYNVNNAEPDSVADALIEKFGLLNRIYGQ